MKGYTAFEDVWGLLADNGVLGPAGLTLLAMMLAGGSILISIRFYMQYRELRIGGGLKGIRTRRQVNQLRAQGQLDGEFTFADAVELTTTGTIRAKSLADKIVNSVVSIEILFSCSEHHIIYQFEMGSWTEADAATWLEVAKGLSLTDISKIMEEVVLMGGVIGHPDFDAMHMSGDETIYDKLNSRAVELHDEFEKIDGVARLRAAGEAYLRKNAPELLPLPTR